MKDIHEVVREMVKREIMLSTPFAPERSINLQAEMVYTGVVKEMVDMVSTFRSLIDLYDLSPVEFNEAAGPVIYKFNEWYEGVIS